MPDWPFKTISRQLMSQIFDNYHEGVIVLTKDTRIVYYNKKMSFLDGYHESEVLGEKITDIYQLNESNSVSLGCLAKQVHISRSAVYRTHLGTVINAQCNAYPFFEEGEFVGAFCFSLDFGLVSTALEDLNRNYFGSPTSKSMPSEAPLTVSHTFASLIGQASSFKQAVENAKVAALHDLPIMVVGETGSGKELFAQAIHNHKSNHCNKFLAVNCAAIPATLLESLLFGTTKGAFTGAMDKVGIFEAARGGSIFWMKSTVCPWNFKVNSCGCFRKKKFPGWAQPVKS